MKQAKAALPLLTAPASKDKKASKKASEKEPAKKSSEKASQKTKEHTALADAPAPELHAENQADYNKAKHTVETTKNKHEAAATKMFQFSANFLSSDAKYL